MSTESSDSEIHSHIRYFVGHKDEINCIAFSPDFEMIVTGSDDERIRVFNTRTGQMVVRLKGQNAAIRCVAISSNSRFIASGSYDKTVIVYQVCDASTLHHLKGHLKSVESVTFSPCCKKLCSSSWDRTAILWDVETGNMMKVFNGHVSLVQSAAFSPCQRMLATGSWDHTIRIWPLNRRAGRHIHELKAHKSNVHSVVFSCHNILASGSWDKQVILWNPYNAQILFVLEGHEGWVQALSFSTDGYLLASVADDEFVKIWDVANGCCLKTLEGKVDSSSHCGFDPSGALIVGGSVIPITELQIGTSTATIDRNKPPCTLLGEEILINFEKSEEKLRAQSAYSKRNATELPEPCTTHEDAPLPEIRHKKEPPKSTEKPKICIEKWLSDSFQML